MTALDTLLLASAAHGGGDGLWSPTILGLLVVVSAVGLFCGSVYLLLGTNVGARLGFLISAACLTGFTTLLTLIWLTTSTPLNSPHGRQPEWKLKEVVSIPAESGFGEVQAVYDDGEQIGDDTLATIRPAVDAGLVKAEPAPGEEAAEQPFARFSTASAFLTGSDRGMSAWRLGGGSKNVFWHEPAYAVVQFCPAAPAPADLSGVPPDPTCAPGAPAQLAVLLRDLGSLRLTPFMYFLGSSVLFALSLLGLHWRERDERARAAAVTAPTPVPAS